MSIAVPIEGESAPQPARPHPGPSLFELLSGLPARGETPVIYSTTAVLTLDDLLAAVDRLATELIRAGVAPGHPVGGLVGSGPSGIVVMFAIWSAGGVYMPINQRSTTTELATLTAETPVSLLIGTRADIDRLADGEQPIDLGLVEFDESTWTASIRRPAKGSGMTYDPDLALILRTSGTTGRPKAVLLRHGGTIDALDSSLRKLRRRAAAPTERQSSIRVNLIPLSLALWSGVFNTLFSLRAGFGVVLLERFTSADFAAAVRTHALKSTVLAPAMITMLCDSDDIDTLAPLEIVRSITAPLSPATARRFHERFGVLVLNSYGQTELGGEVVGWTMDDIRRFGAAKLGAVGRPYDDVDVRILDDDQRELTAGEPGHIHIRSPFRMHGYAATDGPPTQPGEDRLVNDFLRTGDIGRLDEDGFLWIEGRASDMINRGGLKVFPDEVEEVLRRHPTVHDAAVAGVPDPRLGEVPYAWVVPETDGVIDADALAAWCRAELAPYKVPVSFSEVAALPRSEVGKVLRRELSSSARPRSEAVS